MRYLAAFLLTGVVACSLPRTISEAGDIAVEAAPSLLGAVLGFLTGGTGLAVFVGTALGWLTGDTAKARIALEDAAKQVQELKEELAAGPTTTADVAKSFFESLPHIGWILVVLSIVGTLALVYLPFRFGKRKGEEASKTK